MCYWKTELGESYWGLLEFYSTWCARNSVTMTPTHRFFPLSNPTKEVLTSKMMGWLKRLCDRQIHFNIFTNSLFYYVMWYVAYFQLYCCLLYVSQGLLNHHWLLLSAVPSHNRSPISLHNSSTPETWVWILVQTRIFSLKLLIYDLPDGYSES